MGGKGLAHMDPAPVFEAPGRLHPCPADLFLLHPWTVPPSTEDTLGYA